MRVKTAAGAHYAEYTYAPSDRILNGFIQAVVGLYDYTAITSDPLGLKLFEAGDAEARVEVPHYDTGAWSLYDQYSESNLNYHELLTEFLQHLCERTARAAAARRPRAPTPTPTTTTPTPTAATTPRAAPRRRGGGTPPPARAAAHDHDRRAHAAATPIPGDQIYCTTAQHFKADLATPPAISLLTRRSRAARARACSCRCRRSRPSPDRAPGLAHGLDNSAYVGARQPKMLWVDAAAGGTLDSR